MAVIIDMDMPINCVDCDRRYIRGLLDCKLIFSGCANCGRHPNCPLKSTDEMIEEIEDYKIMQNPTGYILNVIHKYCGKENTDADNTSH